MGFKVGDIIGAPVGFVLGNNVLGEGVPDWAGLIELGNNVLGEKELGEKEMREHPSPKRVDSDHL